MKTIKTLFGIILAFLFVLGWGLAATAVHVVWTGDKPVIIPKHHLGVRDTYVNASAWLAEDVSNHPAVARRLLDTGNADALSHVFKASDAQELKAQIQEAIDKGPTSKPATADEAKTVASH